MMLEPGKLYRIDEWLWYLFPSLETATAAHLTSYWSKQLNCNVSFLSEGDVLLVVEVSDIQVKVINQEGKSGWINFPAGEEWTEDTINEISNDA